MQKRTHLICSLLTEEELEQILEVVLSVEEGAARCHCLLLYAMLANVNDISDAQSQMLTNYCS